jgi:hypothetical protein
VSNGYEGGDFERAVAVVSADPSPRALVERLGVDWEYLSWLAVDAAAAVLGEQDEQRGEIVSHTGEAFTAGFLIGVHLGEDGRARPERLSSAVDQVQVRGRHAVIADHCDLASVARLETLYSAALVESMSLDEADGEALVSPVTRVFESGLAVGLELGSGGDETRPGAQQP